MTLSDKINLAGAVSVRVIYVLSDNQGDMIILICTTNDMKNNKTISVTAGCLKGCLCLIGCLCVLKVVWVFKENTIT